MRCRRRCKKAISLYTTLSPYIDAEFAENERRLAVTMSANAAACGR